MSNFRICEGVSWEIANGQSGIARFSESELSKHPSIENLVRFACTGQLLPRLGETIGRGSLGVVKGVIGEPDLVAKLHSEPFSNTAVNIALAAGLANVDRPILLDAPRYLAHLQPFNSGAGHTAVTIMSKVDGVNLSCLFTTPDQHQSFRESEEREQIIKIGSEALLSVGINPDTAYWPDAHENNLMVPLGTQTLREAYGLPMTIIDVPNKDWAEDYKSRYCRQEMLLQV
jgi:hypothetical protein